MEIDLTGKKILLTGGTRGIGRGIALSLAQAGANLITCYRNESDSVESLIRELKDTPGEHHVIRADISQPDQVQRLVDEAGTRFGALDVIVNNAGAISHIPFEKLSLDDWRLVLDTNLTASFLVIQRALPLLGESASVINIGSKVALVGVPMRAHYTAAKAGLIGLTRSLAKELGPRGVRVNVIAPGIIEAADLAERTTPQEYEQMQQRLAHYKKMAALGRSAPRMRLPV
ncbi:SDR family NAD(P)-dependent oxidoreductase [Fodinicola feengrottensis]|uniref:SDR family NAD(P)-dependent oxidoreductase n=1 Tax=Fodinicola feengrottensis TaxID=435914 RepID=UPI002442DAC7|nr:SDR family NAD(P)-dependent oxidoreductase [Fodinicola feengrottensis]